MYPDICAGSSAMSTEFTSDTLDVLIPMFANNAISFSQVQLQ
jgi:hypothetical protein